MNVHAHSKIMTTDLGSIFITYNSLFLDFYIWAHPNSVKAKAQQNSFTSMHLHIYIMKFWQLIWIIYVITFFTFLTFLISGFLHFVKDSAPKNTAVMWMYMHILKFWELIWVIFLLSTTLFALLFRFEHSFMV